MKSYKKYFQLTNAKLTGYQPYGNIQIKRWQYFGASNRAYFERGGGEALNQRYDVTG
jgi:hypothetical protein